MRSTSSSRAVHSILSALATLMFLACGTEVSWTRLTRAPHATEKKKPDDVEVFVSKEPPRDYVEVGVLEARQESAMSFDGTPEIIAAMREEAGRRGCDGIIINGSADKITGGVWTIDNTTSGSIHTLRGFRSTCIVYR